MNRHAYLIIAHSQPQLLKMLCQLLDHPCHDFFIHVNAKARGFDFDEIKNAVKHSQITFIPREVVRWGGYSLVNCEMRLLKAAAENGSYSYYHLLSGVDMPLKSPQQIYDWFENHSGTEFVNIGWSDSNWNAKMEKRIRYYYPLRDKFNARGTQIGLVERKLVELQQKMGVNRLKNMDRKIASGSQWFSITHSLAEHVLQNEQWVEEHFKYCGCGDEIFLQMLMRDTCFERKVYKSDKVKENLRYIDWKRGNPYTFKEEDFDLLINSGCMFARKFDMANHPQICEKIYSYLKAEEI